MSRVFIGIGSNLGDRISNCKQAVDEMRRFSEIVCASPLYETQPVGKEDQPEFINLVAEVNTELSPHELLAKLKLVEDKLGRVKGERWGPRTIDLDILFFGSLVLNEDNLVIPHPRAHQRRFVMQPLYDIAPDFIHPDLKLSIIEILNKLEDKKEVKIVEAQSTLTQQ